VAKYGFTIVTLRKLQLEIGNCIALYFGYKRKTVGLLNRKSGCNNFSFSASTSISAICGAERRSQGGAPAGER